MKRHVVEVFVKCSICGGPVTMGIKEHREWLESKKPAVCLQCRLTPKT